MKKLLLIRHAQAGPHSQNDFDRPLTNHGVNQANKVAIKLQRLKLIPGYLLSSPAKRTHATTDIISKILTITNNAFDDRIYDASTQTLIKVINQIDNEYNFVALVGHNPGVSQLIFELTGDYRDMPTAAAVLISFETDDWQLIHSNTGTVSQYIMPD